MKRRYILLTGLILFLNFAWFFLSLWPYQPLAELSLARNAQGKVVTFEGTENQKIYKSNITKYISINLGVLILGMSASGVFKKRG